VPIKSVKAVQMKPERLRRNGFVKQMSFSLEYKVEEVTDGNSKYGDCDECKIRWTRRVNRMRLT